MRTFLMLFLVLFTTSMAWADAPTEEIGGYTFNKDGKGNLLITSIDDWNGLADAVAKGNDCSGKTFLMTTDIGSEKEPVTKTVGCQLNSASSSRKRFAGTFDGGNYTLTVALTSASSSKNYCAPFAYVKNVKIKDLHVAGTLKASGQFAGGLIGSSGNNASDGACKIQHCQISVEITTNYKSSSSKYGNHGGFIGIAEGNDTIMDSWFDGKFLGLDYQYSAGFIGMNKGSKSLISNCLFNPSEINIKNNNVLGSCEYVHSLNGGDCTLKNAYWVKHFGTTENAQGQQVVEKYGLGDIYTTITAADGNTYYIVTGNSAWLALSETLAGSETSYTLTQDYKAGNTDAALVIPENKEFTLNMNGHTIDRGLTLGTAQKDGFVIKVESGATLTINGGTIKGGNNIGNGGGIYNAGTLNINGTTITENLIEINDNNTVYGGGIYNAGMLNIDGANITDNTSKNRGNGTGVFVAKGGKISMKGNVQINNNYYTFYNPTAVQALRNLYLDYNTIITVDGKLDAKSSIGIAKTGTGAFTKGLKGNGNSSMFSSDNPQSFFVYTNADGEACLSAPVKIELIDGPVETKSKDNITTIDENNGYLVNVTMAGRTLYKDGNWNTICLPFDVDLNDKNGVLSGATIMRLDGDNSSLSDEGVLTLNFVEENTKLDAGIPYIIKWKKAENYVNDGTCDLVAPTFNSVTIKSTISDINTSDKKVTFEGNLNYKEFVTEDKGVLLIGAENKLYYPKANSHIGACRAYFQISDSNGHKVKAFNLNFEEDSETGIISIHNSQFIIHNEEKAIYNLAGQRISKIQKGISIVNGKKVLF